MSSVWGNQVCTIYTPYVSYIWIHRDSTLASLIYLYLNPTWQYSHYSIYVFCLGATQTVQFILHMCFIYGFTETVHFLLKYIYFMEPTRQTACSTIDVFSLIRLWCKCKILAGWSRRGSTLATPYISPLCIIPIIAGANLLLSQVCPRLVIIFISERTGEILPYYCFFTYPPEDWCQGECKECRWTCQARLARPWGNGTIHIARILNDIERRRREHFIKDSYA